MEDLKLQQHITNWLTKNYDKNTHQEILERACVIGSKSKPWTEAIQAYVKDVSMQDVRKAEVKRACHTLLKRQHQEKS